MEYIDFLGYSLAQFQIIEIWLLKQNYEDDKFKLKIKKLIFNYLKDNFKVLDHIIIALFYENIFIKQKKSENILSFSRIKNKLSILKIDVYAKYYSKY